MDSVSLVIPTISRPTLARTLHSLRGQEWMPGDEVILVGDGPQPVARELWDQFGLPGRYMETPRQLGTWGHGIRNWLLDRRTTTGRYLAALDDDDVWTPDALASIRKGIRWSGDLPLIFRMDWTTIGGKVLWEQPELREGNLGTPCCVAPNDPAKLGRYGPRYAGDFDFIKSTCDYYPGPVWREEIICTCRPHLL